MPSLMPGTAAVNASSPFSNSDGSAWCGGVLALTGDDKGNPLADVGGVVGHPFQMAACQGQ
jgi:hypothetical protein